MKSQRAALVVLTLALSALLISACGGTDSTPPAATSQPGASESAELTATATATATVRATVEATGDDTGGEDADLVAQGEQIFQVSAGGVGCAACHGTDARGTTAASAPDIRERNEDDIWNALETRAQMSFIKLTPQEVRAVAAYLETLREQ